jgi:hypothetical protein
MTHSSKDDGKPLQAVGRVLDSRWMMALSVAAVLVAIVWALLEKGPQSASNAEPVGHVELSTVELLGVPDGAEVLLDGRQIDNTRFGVTPGTRHLLEVSDDAGQSWRQVFLAQGSLSLVVELRTHFVEVDVSANEEAPSTD